MSDLVGMKFNMPVFDIDAGKMTFAETEVVAWSDGCDLTGEILTIKQLGEEKDVSRMKFIQSVINSCEKFGESKILH